MQDLAFLFQLSHRTNGFLHRYIRIRPVHQIQINIIRLKISERLLTLSTDQCFRAAADIFTVHIFIAALCRENNMFPGPQTMQCLADILLRSSCIIRRCCINKINAAIKSRFDCIHSLLI